MTALILPALPELFTQIQVKGFMDECQRILASGQSAAKVWQLPAGALVEFDSSALAVCLSLRRQAQAQGAQLQILDCPARLRDLSTLYGVHELLAA